MTDGGRMQLFCLPHAGGTSSVYEPWRALLAPRIEVVPVELPGRGRRLRELPLDDLDGLTEDAMSGILRCLQPPFGLFGHSMGAVLAFECARRLSQTHGCRPLILFASGHRAPHLPPRPGPRVHELDDATFTARARELGGEFNDALEHEELRALFLPVLRSDLKAAEAYVYRPGAALACDIVALGGEQDPHVSNAELLAWAEQTDAEFQVRTFVGGHFFFHHNGEQLLAAVEQRTWARSLNGC